MTAAEAVPNMRERSRRETRRRLIEAGKKLFASRGFARTRATDISREAGVAVGTLFIIGLSSMYKIAQLRGGGTVVAESLGGQITGIGQVMGSHWKALGYGSVDALVAGSGRLTGQVTGDGSGGYGVTDATLSYPNLTASADARTDGASGSAALPLPKKPRLTGKPSAACSIRAICHGPGVQVVALVPSAGPVPPPIIVVMPLINESSTCCGQMK